MPERQRVYRLPVGDKDGRVQLVPETNLGKFIENKERVKSNQLVTRLDLEKRLSKKVEEMFL